MKKIFKMVGLLAVFIGVYYFATIFVGIIIGIVLIIINLATGNIDLTINFENYSEKYAYVTIIFVNIVTVLFMWVLFRIRKENIFKNFNFNRINMKTIGLLIISAVLMQFFLSTLVSYVVQIDGFSNMVTQYTEITEPLMLGNVLIVIIVMGIVTPIFEEFFFRGIIYNELRKNLPVVVALIIQAVIFAAFHGNIIQAIYTIILGVLLALIYNWYKSILSPIIFHLGFNISGIVLSKFKTIQIFDNYRIVFLIFSALFLSVMFIPLWRNKTQNKEMTAV
ncbi:MAG TPA: type II CAAX endopeptidase family protein [Pseudobacteroides sp.]|uniref:CPBP family intramembrane glutamic endopeptidase n=1 Tax=Pseudobacteroides sp. TaxID=1968840 RepID=UPI002F932FDC